MAPLTLPPDNNIGESAKTFPTQNAPISAGTVGRFGDQPVVETLVISFQMVMGDVSANGRAKMILSERNDPVETLVLYRTNKQTAPREASASRSWAPALLLLLENVTQRRSASRRSSFGTLRRGITLVERLLTETRVVVFYMSLLVYPHPSRLRLDYDFSLSRPLLSPPTTLLSLLVIFAAVGVALYRWRKNRFLSFAIQSTSRETARCYLAPLAFIEAVYPKSSAVAS